MVSGWDKSPGPGNDYSPNGGGSLWKFAVAVLVVTMLYVGFATLSGR